MAMAEFEGLLKNCVEHAHQSIEMSSTCVNQLRPGLRMLHYDSAFASASASGPSIDAAWNSRMNISAASQNTDLPRLPRRQTNGSLQPLGNRTPNAATMSRLWRVYELPGQPFPRLSWRRSLGILCEIRNDVAHARVPFAKIFTGRDRTADAVGQLVSDLRDLGMHFTQSLVEYLADSRFEA